MLHQFKTDLKLHKNDFWIFLLVELGGFLFGFVMVNIIMRVDEDPGSWFCMGTLMALVTGVMLALLVGGFGYNGEFQVAISMGRTRAAFMGSYALRLLLQILFDYIVILAFYRLELAVYPLLFPAYENEVAFTFLTNWRILLPCALGLLILAMFLGAIYGRYGKKGMWVFYFIWLIGCFILPRTFDDEPGSGLLDKAAMVLRTLFSSVPPTAWLIFAGVLAVSMAAATVTFGKKQMVRL